MSTFPIDLDPLALPNSPTPEPQNIRAGDTVQWERQSGNYPPGTSAAYALSYTLVSRANVYQVASSLVTVDGENYKVTIPAATTATWAPGNYRWQAYINDASGNRWTIAEGVLEVLPNLQALTAGFDDREPDEIILDNINAMILAKSQQDVESYRIFERELHLYTWKDVLNAKSVFEGRVRAIRVRRGEIPASRTRGVSFNHAY